MPPKRRRRRTSARYPARDLSYVTTQGGRTRRHKYWREIRIFFWPVTITIGVQAVLYLAVMMRTGRDDWDNILAAIGALACVPVIAGAVLTAFRRHGTPIVSATVIGTGLFSVAVSVLSALRIPVSYQALATCLPVVIVLLAYANLRFHRTVNRKVALAPFARAATVAKKIEEVRILSGPADDLEDVEILLIDPLAHHSEKWSSLLAACYLGGIEVVPWMRYLEVKHGRLDVASFEIAHLVYSPSQLLYARCKRFLDISAVLVTLPITLLLSAAVALYIFLRDGGPVLFVQIRRGYGGRRFRLYKFRTMYKGTGGGATNAGDSRIIPGCTGIRHLRLDELPQLFNILRGEMSLIGPRPVAEYVSRSSEAVEPKYALRSLVLPGITGWAQVKSGYAGTTDEEIEKLSYDLYYIKHLSFDLDLLVLFKTVKTVLFGIGAR